MIELLQSMPQGSTSIILVILLITVLVVAYKIMEMVFDTFSAAAISGAFYTGLTYLFSAGEMTGFQINELLLFIFMGATLYMLYTLIMSVYSATSTLIEIPIEMGKIILYPFKKLWGHHKKKTQKKKERKKHEKTQKDEQSTKEVVLDNIKEEDEDE